MEYAVYIRYNFDGSYATGQTFTKASLAIAYANAMEKQFKGTYAKLVKLAFK